MELIDQYDELEFKSTDVIDKKLFNLLYVRLRTDKELAISIVIVLNYEGQRATPPPIPFPSSLYERESMTTNGWLAGERLARDGGETEDVSHSSPLLFFRNSSLNDVLFSISVAYINTHGNQGKQPLMFSKV